MFNSFKFWTKQLKINPKKNEDFCNKQKRNKNQEQKVDDAFAQVNQCLDKIENYPIIKKKINHLIMWFYGPKQTWGII